MTQHEELNIVRELYQNCFSLYLTKEETIEKLNNHDKSLVEKGKISLKLKF